MFSEELFENVLIAPIADGADHLYVLSGYATAAMAFHHMNFVKKRGNSIKIDLVVGMCPSDGLSVSNHKGFKKLVEEDYAGQFQCSYVMVPPAVHSKIYVWGKEGSPFLGFAGSANYTQNAFHSRQREVMTSCGASEAFNYFKRLLSDTIYCTHNDAENFIQIYNKNYTRKKERIIEQEDHNEFLPDNIIGLPKVDISLLDREGTLPTRSGLNWGQRPEQNREPNQAYIHVPASVYHTEFFPERTVHFTVLTDDGKTMICTRAQENGKAIQTPHNNSLIGEYFRNRLGLASGVMVSETDLERYGRNSITFYKIDDETYYMDFSVYG